MRCKTTANLMFFILIATTSSVADEVDPACLSRVKTFGQAAWQEAARRMKDIEFTFHKKTRELDLTHKKPTTTVESDGIISLLFAKGRWLIDERYEKYGKDGVRVRNEAYSFSIARGKNDRKNVFRLVKASKNELVDGKQDLGDEFKIVMDSLGAAYGLRGSDLNQLIIRPDDEIVLAKFIGEGTPDDRSIRLEWESKSSKGQRSWAEFGPKTSWMVQRCGIKSAPGVEILRSVDYQPYEQGHFPKVVTTTIKFPQYNQTETLTIGPPHPCTRPDAEFYLPYYGFSESVVDVTRTSPWVRTAAIFLSSIGVVAAFVFYRMSKKSQPPVARGD